MRAVSLAFLLTATGCGSVQKMAISTTSDILKDGSLEMETERDWNVFAQSLPAGVKTMEAMAYVDPENSDLMLALAKGYTAMAYGISETLYLEDYFKENENSPYKQAAEIQYSKAVQYGMNYLAQEDITLATLNQALAEDTEAGVGKLLSQKLSAKNQDDLEAILFTAQAWGGLINLKKSVALMAQAPLIKGMFDWVCNTHPDIAGGVCAIMLGAYDLGRPQTLGGNPARGRMQIEKAIEKNLDNLLARVAYLQFWVIPAGDQAAYRTQKDVLLEKGEKFKQQSVWIPGTPALEKDRLNLYNAIALKRFEIIKKFEAQLF